MTTLNRRDFVALAGAAGASLGLARCSQKDDVFPSRDITFIIPYGPGGGFDTYARAVAPAIERYLPQKVNVVPMNIPAGGGGKGMTQLYRSPPDGYTFGIFNIPGAFILQHQQGGRGFDLNKFTWLGTIGAGETYAIGVKADSPLKSIADMRELSRTRPVKFTCTGPEGTAYSAILISCELLGVKPQIITGYKSSNDYVVAALRGDGDAVLATVANLKRFADSGTIRIVATFEEHSSIPGADDATTLGQPELSKIAIERMVAGPPDMPPDIKNTLAMAIDKAVRDPQVVAWAEMADVPWGAYPLGHADTLIREQSAFFEKWKKFLTAT
jgi:tripartite-type tricarboxylate transporter receptor subunit TctC